MYVLLYVLTPLLTSHRDGSYHIVLDIGQVYTPPDHEEYHPL
jgi:hypothetical protein